MDSFILDKYAAWGRHFVVYLELIYSYYCQFEKICCYCFGLGVARITSSAHERAYNESSPIDWIRFVLLSTYPL
jgi:hypothetical protein